MTTRTFAAIVVGSGPFAAICAIRLAARHGPERMLFATTDTEIGGSSYELFAADQADPAAVARLDRFIVAEWDRFAIVDGAHAQMRSGRTCLLDPAQVRAEFLETCAGMTVLKQVRMTLALDGYLIVDGNIHATETLLYLPGGQAGRSFICEGMEALGLQCPVLLDAQPGTNRQVIPVAPDRVLVNALPQGTCRDDSGHIDLPATFGRQLDLVNRVPD